MDNTKASIGIGGFGEQTAMNTAIFLDGVRINNKAWLQLILEIFH